MSRTVVVSTEQVEFAQAAIEMSGGPDKVDPLIVKIANAKPRPRRHQEPHNP